MNNSNTELARLILDGNLVNVKPERIKFTHDEIKAMGLGHHKTAACNLYCAWLRFGLRV